MVCRGFGLCVVVLAWCGLLGCEFGSLAVAVECFCRNALCPEGWGIANVATAAHLFYQANVLGTMLRPVKGFLAIGPTMEVSVQDVGEQLQSNLDSRLVQYVMAAREQMGSQSCWHMASDKAFAAGMHLQNTIITCPNSRAALCCPQAIQML